MTELRYAEASAYQKIQALRLMHEVPEVEEKLKQGSLTLSNAAQVQSFAQAARRQNLEVPSRESLITQVENRSKRETEKILASLTPQSKKPDRIRAVTETHAEIRFTTSERLVQKLEKIKTLRSHVHPHPTMEELLEDMADLLIARLDPEQKRTRNKSRAPQTRAQPVTQSTSESASPRSGVPPRAEIELHPGEVTSLSKPTVHHKITSRKAIPRATKRAVWTRDHGSCTYCEPHSGRKCGSTHQLEFDHRIPWALGGPDTLDNLRLRCRMHNKLTAVQVFGAEKIKKSARI